MQGDVASQGDRSGGGSGSGSQHARGRWNDAGTSQGHFNGRSAGRWKDGRGGVGGRSRGGGRGDAGRSRNRFQSSSSGGSARYGGRSSGSGRSSASGRTYGPPDVIEEIGTRTANTIAVAVEGCCHGQLTAIYDRLRQHTDPQTGNVQPIDLLICCGDFQSLRTPADFHSLAVPPKYREMGTFHRYYSGEWTAPVLTLFIGGNHEASQPLSELYYGGWVAPNMYYLGAAGVVRYRNIRIGGLSGIYKSHDHVHSRFELPPYDNSSLRSIYHYRNVEVYRMLCLAGEGCDHASDGITGSTSQIQQQRQRLAIMMSHDWPQGIEQHGDTDELIRRKPFFRQEIADNSLGSPPNARLLHTLQPSYWFSAHLHVKFKAMVPHNVNKAERSRVTFSPSSKQTAATGLANSLIPSQVITSSVTNSCERREGTVENARIDTGGSTKPGSSVQIASTDDNQQVDHTEKRQLTTQFVAPESSPSSKNCGALPDLTDLMTQFLSLDKCLPRRQYLSIVHIPVEEGGAKDEIPKLEYDLEWLAILRKTHYLSLARDKHRVNVPQNVEHGVTPEELEWVQRQLGPDPSIPLNFAATVPPHTDGELRRLPPPLPRMGNPQTDHLLSILQLEHLPNLTIPYDSSVNQSFPPNSVNMIDSSLDIARTKTIRLDNDDENEIDLDGVDETSLQDTADGTGEHEGDTRIGCSDVEDGERVRISQDTSKKPKLVDSDVSGR